jgi:hypothetical protein
VFGTLKEALQGRKISQQRRGGDSAFLASTKKKLFFTEKQNFVERCEKCIAKDDDYMEK